MSEITEIITHPGGAHKDDFLACCLLAYQCRAPISRREPEPADLDDPHTAVIDVGGAMIRSDRISTTTSSLATTRRSAHSRSSSSRWMPMRTPSCCAIGFPPPNIWTRVARMTPRSGSASSATS